MTDFDRRLVGAFSDKGPVRKANEDAYWVSDSTTPTELGALYIVTDGVGGQVHGAAAAHQAVQVMSQAFYDLRREGASIPEALKDSIHRANMAIYEQAQARGSGKMGCTLVATVQFEGRLHVAHVGDARAYLLQGNRLRRLTRDDTWVQKQVEAGIITAKDAEQHELRNVVTQALGNKPEIDVHISEPQELEANNVFLLCSDGLHGVLSNEQLYLTMRNNRPQEAASELVEMAIAANTQDNVTAVVVNTGSESSADTFVEASVGQEKARPSLPLWIPISLVVVVIILVILALVRLVASDDLTIDLGGGAASEPEMVITETATALPQPSATQQLTPILLPAPTGSPTAGTQAEPTMILTDTPPPSSNVTTSEPQLACLVGQGLVFVWTDEQVFSGTCNHVSQDSLVPGMQVRITDANVRSIAGPDRSCRFNDFIKVQSVDNPAIEGWVLEGSVRPIEPEGSCLP